jgi:hypothetical protein
MFWLYNAAFAAWAKLTHYPFLALYNYGDTDLKKNILTIGPGTTEPTFCHKVSTILPSLPPAAKRS